MTQIIWGNHDQTARVYKIGIEKKSLVGNRRTYRYTIILSIMKPVLLLLALIGLTRARPQFEQFRQASRTIGNALQQPLAYIIRYDANLGVPTGFSYAVQTSDGFNNAVIGETKNEGTPDEALAVEGQYSYVGDDGQTYSVHYTADENGFQPSGAHIPPAASTKRKLGIPSAALASLAGGGLG